MVLVGRGSKEEAGSSRRDFLVEGVDFHLDLLEEEGQNIPLVEPQGFQK
jgi:hypothetical protein